MLERGRRIMIDGSMARGGGGFTYLVNIVPYLARLAPQDQFRVLVSDQRLAEALPQAANVGVEFLGQLGLRDRLRFTYFEARRRAREWEADLYFSAGEQAPARAHCPTIASFRNPNVFAFGEEQNLKPLQRLRLRVLNGLARLSASRCSRVMFVSNDSARWIGDSIGLPEERRTVIHHGIDADAWSPEPGVVPDRPYILSVSSIYPYKNYVRLIEAYAELAQRHPDVPDLVIIGDNQDPAYAKKMEAAREFTGELAQSIRLLGEVPYSQVRAYYACAALFVFPSWLETFGHPMLEAMASGVPVVASDLPVFREVADDAALYADPFDVESLAGAMEAVLFSEQAARALVKRGHERVKRFTWQRSTERLLTMFRSVLAESTATATEPLPRRPA